jgi:hypothetical protein
VRIESIRRLARVRHRLLLMQLQTSVLRLFAALTFVFFCFPDKEFWVAGGHPRVNLVSVVRRLAGGLHRWIVCCVPCKTGAAKGAG